MICRKKNLTKKLQFYF